MTSQQQSYKSLEPLSKTHVWAYILLSLCLVAFGQPAWIPACGYIAAICGYAIFWRILLEFPLPGQRFWISTVWFFAVQLIQLSWFISHPYLYIFAVYFLLSLIMGVQFGLIGIFIQRQMSVAIWKLLTIASIWTVFEWSRLFLLSGFSFNPIGMALAGNTYSLQIASIAGVFGMSFWVLLTNLLALRASLKSWQPAAILLWLAAAVGPYAFGFLHISIHQALVQKNEGPMFKAILVQTAFPVEESIDFNTKKNMINYVVKEWRQILEITRRSQKKAVDLIALPEFVVPFGTYANIYPKQIVEETFKEVFGPDSLKFLPEPKWPFASSQQTSLGEVWMVNNAYWVQSMANYFQASVIAGLEDCEDSPSGEREYYSAALLFHPLLSSQEEIHELPERYEKRILVPMGEYIPFTFCRELAKQYGIFGSFTPGKEAKVMACQGKKISPSICYEETFGQLIREGRQKGADILVNLTSDVWYPNSRLPRQHLEHARLRTVENGVPLLRACNTGITAAVDCFGRDIAVFGDPVPEKAEWTPGSLFAELPGYSYPTLYSSFGDALIIGFSLLMILGTCSFPSNR